MTLKWNPKTPSKICFWNQGDLIMICVRFHTGCLFRNRQTSYGRVWISWLHPGNDSIHHYEDRCTTAHGRSGGNCDRPALANYGTCRSAKFLVSINQEYTGYFIRYNLSFPRSCGSPFQYLGLTLDELLQWESHMNAHRQYCALLVMMCSLLTFYIGVNAV